MQKTTGLLTKYKSSTMLAHKEPLRVFVTALFYLFSFPLYPTRGGIQQLGEGEKESS